MDDFKQKYSLWKKCLFEDKPYAIFWQLEGMFWNDAVYQVVNTTRTGSPIHHGAHVDVNPLIHHFMDEGYVSYQLSAIRRMIDTNPMEGPKAVYSLYRLIDDMKNYHTMFTRKNIFEAANLDPDIETKRKEMDALLSKYPGQPVYTPRNLNTLQEEWLHNSVDRLSGVSRTRRHEDDKIPEQVFQRLLQKLSDVTLVSLKGYVDKFIAHNATPESIERINADEIKVTQREIRKAQEILCRTYNFLAENFICGASTFSLATAAFNLFDHLENPLIQVEQKQSLQDIWNKNEADIRDWKSWNDI